MLIQSICHDTHYDQIADGGGRSQNYAMQIFRNRQKDINYEQYVAVVGRSQRWPDSCHNRMVEWHEDVQYYQSEDGCYRRHVRHPFIFPNKVFSKRRYQGHPDQHNTRQIAVHFRTDFRIFLKNYRFHQSFRVFELACKSTHCLCCNQHDDVNHSDDCVHYKKHRQIAALQPLNIRPIECLQAQVLAFRLEGQGTFS